MDDRASSRRIIEDLYDEVGDLEWFRLERDAAARTSFGIHRRFLNRHVPRGAAVLEIGAGPGRFTIALAELGCEIAVSDLSAVQLELNEKHVRESGAEHAVRSRTQIDVCDLSQFADSSFDAVVAYGGPFSYLFGEERRAMSECLRVARPRGVVVVSVMSLAGSARRFFDAFPPSIDAVGLELFGSFLTHGDQRVIADAPGVHPCRLFSWPQIEELVTESGGRILDASASNWLSLGSPETVEWFESDPELWDRFLDWEERFCGEAAALDGGTHISSRPPTRWPVDLVGLDSLVSTSPTTQACGPIAWPTLCSIFRTASNDSHANSPAANRPAQSEIGTRKTPVNTSVMPVMLPRMRRGHTRDNRLFPSFAPPSPAGPASANARNRPSRSPTGSSIAAVLRGPST